MKDGESYLFDCLVEKLMEVCDQRKYGRLDDDERQEALIRTLYEFVDWTPNRQHVLKSAPDVVLSRFIQLWKDYAESNALNVESANLLDRVCEVHHGWEQEIATKRQQKD